ncbi:MULTISPECIES: hypothetical protein [Halorussus]|uniref:hypothetical protein n=1 Tax=Halorussus TaxID=1070314 RepID=UPI00209DFDE9|nr:hypothetical protein [Halorussus vallis]USZ75228.1 hypothetical protein NGM07_17565 [Halorussus vallis]
MAFELSRRSFLAATAGSVGVTLPTARSAEKNEQTNYVLKQGDSCVPVVPLSGDEPVEEFYDYRTPNTDPKSFKYASFGTTDLQRENTSIVFLYDGPEGLSLVVVHGKLGADDDGGSVTMGFAGLAGGEWAVGDDIYDADTNYDEFGQTDDGWRVDWTYAGGRTDGGAYRGLGEDFEVTVTPNFNEEANLYGEHYDGTIEDWQLLSGDSSSPERTSLSMSEPVTIRAGTCGSSGSGGSGGDGKKDESGPVNANATLVQDRVNPESNGRIQVALRSSATFDATTLNVGTATFGPNDAHPKHAETTDVNGDGRPDLLLHFRVADTGVSWETGTMTLEAETDEGRTVTGEVEVKVVPQKGKQGGDEKTDEKENC